MRCSPFSQLPPHIQEAILEAVDRYMATDTKPPIELLDRDAPQPEETA